MECGEGIERKTFSNNTDYQVVLREGRRKGSGRRVVTELEQENQHPQEKVSMSHSGGQQRDTGSMVYDQQLC